MRKGPTTLMMVYVRLLPNFNLLRMLVKTMAEVRSTRLLPPVRSAAKAARVPLAGAVCNAMVKAGLLLNTCGGRRPLKRYEGIFVVW